MKSKPFLINTSLFLFLVFLLLLFQKPKQDNKNNLTFFGNDYYISWKACLIKTKRKGGKVLKRLF